MPVNYRYKTEVLESFCINTTATSFISISPYSSWTVFMLVGTYSGFHCIHSNWRRPVDVENSPLYSPLHHLINFWSPLSDQ